MATKRVHILLILIIKIKKVLYYLMLKIQSLNLLSMFKIQNFALCISTTHSFLSSMQTTHERCCMALCNYHSRCVGEFDQTHVFTLVKCCRKHIGKGPSPLIRILYQKPPIHRLSKQHVSDDA